VNLFWAGLDETADIDRTLRGGGWFSPPGEVGVSVRRALYMLEESSRQVPNLMVGFRCARDVE